MADVKEAARERVEQAREELVALSHRIHANPELAALKCVTCGLLFRNRSELDWHIRQGHLRQGLPPIRDQPTPPAASSKDRR